MLDGQLVLGEEVRDEAVERVGSSVDPVWFVMALDAVDRVASKGQKFTTDEIWRRLDVHGAFDVEPRAMGAVMRKAVREGWCRATGEYRRSTRPECHARPVRVWEPCDEHYRCREDF